MKRVSELKKEGYEGTDMNIEISLYEYGLIGKEGDTTGEYRIIHGIGVDDQGDYNMFNCFTITKDYMTELIEEDWFDLSGFRQYIDTTKEVFLTEIEDNPIGAVDDLISYHGIENFTGHTYMIDGFKVKNDYDCPVSD